MCNHVFVYPEDKRENYNSEGKLTGKCRCGATQQSYGMRTIIPLHEDYLRKQVYRGTLFDDMEGRMFGV